MLKAPRLGLVCIIIMIQLAMMQTSIKRGLDAILGADGWRNGEPLQGQRSLYPQQHVHHMCRVVEQF